MEAEIGIIGGSGFYDLASGLKEIKVETPYGLPSDKIVLGKIAGRKVAFLPRHGKRHQFPPHKIPYKANLFAFKKLGITRVIAPCAAGSLQPSIKPGDFVILDQFFDRTKGREDTYYHGPEVTHIAGASPYCPQLRGIAFQAAKELKIPVHEKGAVVVINGPRFSTISESKFFTKQGWEVINMTQYPEVILARELEMCYVGTALITDWDVGLVSAKRIKPVEFREVIKVFNQNVEKARKLVFEIIKDIPKRRSCPCRRALEGARFS